MTRRRYWLLGLGLGAVVWGTAVASNWAGDDSQSEEERSVTQAEVPAAALATLKELANSATITEFAEETEHGGTFYEGSWRGPSGQNMDVLVTAAGALVEIEETLSVDQLPAAVRAAVRKAAGEKTELSVEKKTMILYEARFQKQKQTHELVVTPDGRPYQEEVKKPSRGAQKQEDEEEEEDEDRE